jgi:hypothetical protein
MNNGRERVREQLAKLAAQSRQEAPRRTAESIAREAYRSSRIEGCEVDYSRLVETAQDAPAGGEVP